jgi:hypothetical protein
MSDNSEHGNYIYGLKLLQHLVNALFCWDHSLVELMACYATALVAWDC